jgi:hypothetical protein
MSMGDRWQLSKENIANAHTHTQYKRCVTFVQTLCHVFFFETSFAFFKSSNNKLYTQILLVRTLNVMRPRDSDSYSLMYQTTRVFCTIYKIDYLLRAVKAVTRKSRCYDGRAKTGVMKTDCTKPLVYLLSGSNLIS